MNNAPSQMPELKPCPFCGELPVCVNTPEKQEIYCEDCDIPNVSGETFEECQAAWNTRAASVPCDNERADNLPFAFEIKRHNNRPHMFFDVGGDREPTLQEVAMWNYINATRRAEYATEEEGEAYMDGYFDGEKSAPDQSETIKALKEALVGTPRIIQTPCGKEIQEESGVYKSDGFYWDTAKSHRVELQAAILDRDSERYRALALAEKGGV